MDQQRENMTQYTQGINKLVRPALSYIDAFCTNLFASLTLQELDSALTSSEATPRLLELLSHDYTDPETTEDGQSLVTGVLGVRDSGLGMGAVQGFNRALLESGVVREFVKEHQDRVQQ